MFTLVVVVAPVQGVITMQALVAVAVAIPAYIGAQPPSLSLPVVVVAVVGAHRAEIRVDLAARAVAILASRVVEGWAVSRTTAVTGAHKFLVVRQDPEEGTPGMLVLH